LTERSSDHRLSLADLRENYQRGGLLESDCDSNPIVQFERWFKQAKAADLKEPNAMTLATVSAGGKPSARIVLLKEVSDRGFVFYTNYGSRKAQDCDSNSSVALTFLWAELERQVRVEGTARRITREESAKYFARRPRGSQLGAWISQQSRPAASRDLIEAKLNDIEAKFEGAVPVPDFWGGYRVEHEVLEFWQGRPNRLHDRLVYTRRDDEDGWKLERLWP
jgi:pyridoxamine 5'-phosphate oxidase